jgi:hypothetical protein
MNNGQLKAGYNWQVATQNQFILHYTVHQNPTDIRCLIPHFEHFKATGLPLPTWFIADAGYGSESNYLYMEEQKPSHRSFPTTPIAKNKNDRSPSKPTIRITGGMTNTRMSIGAQTTGRSRLKPIADVPIAMDSSATLRFTHASPARDAHSKRTVRRPRGESPNPLQPRLRGTQSQRSGKTA